MEILITTNNSMSIYTIWLSGFISSAMGRVSGCNRESIDGLGETIGG